jgi:hypothetical protein
MIDEAGSASSIRTPPSIESESTQKNAQASGFPVPAHF